MAACDQTSPARRDRGEPAAGSGEPAPTKVVAVLDTSCLEGATHTTGTLRWFEDNFDGAAACAVALNRPLIVDMWAPWCHTCVSMREFVLPDPALADAADKFVFVALDTDRPVNAKAVAAFPPAAWPTFYAISDGATLQARHVGAANVAQFRAFLDEGARGHAARRQPAPAPDAGALMAQADALAASGGDAAAAYEAALTRGGAEWARRAEALVNLIQVHYKAKRWDACLAVAEQHAASTPMTSARGDLLAYALSCAEAAAPLAQAAGSAGSAAPPVAAELLAQAKRVRELAVPLLLALVDDQTAAISVDDRSDAMMNLRTALDALGQHPQALRMATAQRQLLDEAAAKAGSPAAASTYNWPRAEVYVYLGVPLELVPALEQSAADLPDNYDPPHRTAWLYFKAGKLAEAKQWVDKALALAYGPRRERVQKLADDIAAAASAAPAN